MDHDKVIVEKVIIQERIGPWLRGILYGGLIGYGIALLFAPRRGTETRTILAERGSELRDRAMTAAEDYRYRATRALDSARESLSTTMETAGVSGQGSGQPSGRQGGFGGGQMEGGQTGTGPAQGGKRIAGHEGRIVDSGQGGGTEENIMNDATTRTYDL